MVTKTDYRQRQYFWNAIYSSTALSEAIEWITSQFGPNDIYEDKVLEEWALDNGFVRIKEMGNYAGET